ncbi:tripartite tricarboxylate transporter substrate binding protein [Alicycliphilus denitrificans]|uniref:tripartite tricarboxylate transporter substrate binding protein n=1 Tax=Alicycliphilus denitrificans TaxID=179636 RepID=UPI00384BEC17
MKRTTRAGFIRRIGLSIAFAAAAAMPCAAMAEDAASYPTKPLRLLVPFPPGGAADVFARFIGDRLAQSWKQAVIVENRPGGGGVVATQVAVKAPADGYTLLVVTVGHAVNPHIQAKLPYDTLKDLQPVARIATLPSVLVVNNNLPVRNVAELIALARERQGKLTYASSGNATTSHVAGALFTSQARIQLMHVPYKGSAPAITDLIGGQVDMMIDPLVSSGPHIQSGKLRALAVSTAQRSPLAPDLPTLAEAGVPGYDFSSWFIMLAPTGVPAPIVNKITGEVARILAQPETREKFVQLGAEPGRGTPAELQAFLASEVKRYADVAKAAGMRVD